MKGSCLCGRVEYEIEPPFSVFQYCHCSRCRKNTGSAHSANLFVPPEQFHWVKGADQVGTYDIPEAKYLTTAFCTQCGSSLPWEVKGGRSRVVPAGSLDDDPGIQPEQNIFWGSRAPWCVETSELPKHETRPPRKQ
jgi:hypothetical protein